MGFKDVFCDKGHLFMMLGGAVGMVAAQAIAGNKKVQDATYKGAVATTSAAIEAYDYAVACAQDIKDGANDMYAEATEQAKEREMIKQKRAEIERRARELVAAEMEKAEKEAEAKKAAADEVEFA